MAEFTRRKAKDKAPSKASYSGASIFTFDTTDAPPCRLGPPVVGLREPSLNPDGSLNMRKFPGKAADCLSVLPTSPGVVPIIPGGQFHWTTEARLVLLLLVQELCLPISQALLVFNKFYKHILDACGIAQGIALRALEDELRSRAMDSSWKDALLMCNGPRSIEDTIKVQQLVERIENIMARENIDEAMQRNAHMYATALSRITQRPVTRLHVHTEKPSQTARSLPETARVYDMDGGSQENPQATGELSQWDMCHVHFPENVLQADQHSFQQNLSFSPEGAGSDLTLPTYQNAMMPQMNSPTEQQNGCSGNYCQSDASVLSSLQGDQYSFLQPQQQNYLQQQQHASLFTLQPHTLPQHFEYLPLDMHSMQQYPHDLFSAGGLDIAAEEIPNVYQYQTPAYRY